MDIDAKNTNGETALDVVSQHRSNSWGQVARVLLKFGVSVSKTAEKNMKSKNSAAFGGDISYLISESKKAHSANGTPNRSHRHSKLKRHSNMNQNILSNSEFASSVIDLKMNDQVVCQAKNGTKIVNNNSDKKTKGSIVVYEHGLIFSYASGWVKKTQHEDTFYWTATARIESNKANVS